MKAGAELDAVVARVVMREEGRTEWLCVLRHDHDALAFGSYGRHEAEQHWERYLGGKNGKHEVVPKVRHSQYSVSMVAAWRVVEFMRSRSPEESFFSLVSQRSDQGFFCYFSPCGGGPPVGAEAETAALAISLSALHAFGVTYEKR